MSVSRETMLVQFAELLRKWNPAINLVAPSSLEQLEFRHLADCRQLADLMPVQVGNWLDIGSGGGLPGLVIAIFKPDIAVTLIESDQRKAAFLRTCVRELRLQNVTIINSRIENTPAQYAKHISARALAPLPVLLNYVKMHLGPEGTAWLMKGKNWRTEVEEANQTWLFDLTVHPSKTEPEAAILEITGIHHV